MEGENQLPELPETRIGAKLNEVRPEVKTIPKTSKTNPFFILTSIGMVLFLVLSVWFYVGREDEKDKRMVAVKKLEQTLVAKKVVEQNLKEATENNEKLTGQVQELEGQVSSLEDQLAGVNQEKDRLAKEVEEKEAKLQEISELVESEKTEKATLAQELESLRTEYNDTKDELTSLENEKEELEKQLKEARASQQPTVQQAQQPSAVDLGKISVGAVSQPTTPAPISQMTSPELPGKMGRILVVNDEFNFIVVSFGKNDGLKGGEVLNIYRDGQLIGKVQVEKLYEAISAATILDGKAGLYKEGDSVRL